VRGRGWRKGGEMTRTLYAHMNKIKIKKTNIQNNFVHFMEISFPMVKSQKYKLFINFTQVMSTASYQSFTPHFSLLQLSLLL
jgi:hypothetical protein